MRIYTIKSYSSNSRIYSISTRDCPYTSHCHTESKAYAHAQKTVMLAEGILDTKIHFGLGSQRQTEMLEYKFPVISTALSSKCTQATVLVINMVMDEATRRATVAPIM